MIKKTCESLVNKIEKLVLFVQLAMNAELKALWKTFALHPEGQKILGAQDVFFLYREIIRYKPKRVLEYGTGIGTGTAAVALALKKLNAGGKIVTVEQNGKCHDLARELIPEDLKPFIQFVRSDARAVQFTQVDPYQYWSSYDFESDGADLDYVIVDGPGAWKEGQHVIKLPAGDIFKVCKQIPRGGRVFIDRRWRTVDLYERFLCSPVDPRWPDVDPSVDYLDDTFKVNRNRALGHTVMVKQ